MKKCYRDCNKDCDKLDMAQCLNYMSAKEKKERERIDVAKQEYKKKNSCNKCDTELVKANREGKEYKLCMKCGILYEIDEEGYLIKAKGVR